MTRREFGKITTAMSALVPGKAESAKGSEQLPGVWRLRFGIPEAVTPVSSRFYPPAKQSFTRLPPVNRPPLAFSEITGGASERGFELTFPLAGGEMLYGLGLQFHSLLQRGRKKKLRVNADPVADIGDSHAPVPFYVSNAGYAVLVDSARYINIYCGGKVKKHEGETPSAEPDIAARISQLPSAFDRYHMAERSEVLVEIPKARGVDVYVFAGPTLREAVQRYVLFSGGGALPPRWGLGFWYRCYGKFNQQEVLKIADELRRESIPCDVLGLEPGWQSHSYSCSFVWSDLFPAPPSMIAELKKSNYEVNLWEHAFTHPSSPLHQPLYPLSGNYEVWGGLVPDFLDPGARDIFGDYHHREFVAKGISGFKLDECDNSDYTGNWSFPELSEFPSHADGEQMHSLFGLHYQQTIQSAYDRHGLRTFGLVRSSHALAAPFPYVLYSDLYDHRQFVRALVNSSFSGLLWCPEVRDAVNEEDLVRRLQTVIFSPLAMVNAWYIKNPPWKQVDREANNAGHFSDGWENVEALCRKLIEVRMQLIPYLHAAFIRYREAGIPPVRALVIDYPHDVKTWTIDDQYMFGEDMLVAPVFAGQKERPVYLPEGQWFDFWTGSKYAGAQIITATPSLETTPAFVKSGTILPLAQSTLHTKDPNAFKLVVRAYGGGVRPATLYEEDGSADPKIAPVMIEWNLSADSGTVERSGPKRDSSYSVIRWERVT